MAHPQPAREALAARLHLIERQQRARQVHDGPLLVADDETAGAEHRARRRHLVEVQRHIELIGGQNAAQRPPRLQELQRLAVRVAAAHLLDDLPHRHAERNLDEPGIADVSREARDGRSAALLRSDAGEPLRAPPDDLRRVTERLDVVDVGRLAPHAVGRGKRRAEARHRAFALHRLHQRRLLARDVGLPNQRRLHFERELCPQDAASEQAVFVAGGDGGARPVYRRGVPVPDEHDAVRRARRVARDDAPLDQRERVGLQDRLVVERARVALLAVAEDVLHGRRIAREETPLHSGGERRPAASAQAGVFDLLEGSLRRQLRQGAVQPRESAARDVLIEVDRVYFARVPQRDANLAAHHRQVLQAGNAGNAAVHARQGELDGGFPPANVALHDGGGLIRRDVAVQNARPARDGDVDERLCVAEAARPHFGNRRVDAALRDRVSQRGQNRLRARRLAHQPRSDANPRLGMQRVPALRRPRRKRVVCPRHSARSPERTRSSRTTAASSDIRPASS